MTGVHHIAKIPEHYEAQADSKSHTIRKRFFLKMVLYFILYM